MSITVKKTTNNDDININEKRTQSDYIYLFIFTRFFHNDNLQDIQFHKFQF